jgi:RimJ/RimL family protein N-acetyltransferase
MPALRLPDPPLTDGEITLRPHRAEDADAVVEILQEPDISKWTLVPFPYRHEHFHEWLEGSLVQATLGTGLHLQIADAGGHPIGAVGISEIDWERGTGDVGYWVAKPARGRGVCTRAVRLFSRWLLDETELRYLEILAHRDNAPSRAVARAAGYVETGEYRTLTRMGAGDGADYAVAVYPAEPDAAA